MAKRCGDATRFKYKVTSELIGKYVTLLICRKKKFDFAGVFTEKITKEETKKIKWPDQEIEDKADDFYGGRKVDFKGLDKLSYKEKFEHQEFEINLYQGPHKKRSAKSPLKIEPYDPSSESNIVVGIPMNTEYWEETPIIDLITGETKSILYCLTDEMSPESFKAKDMNCGRFDLEFKDGVFIITVKIKLVSSVEGKSTDKAFELIKNRAEAFWNSDSSGFNQWNHHRTKCERKEKCKCSVVKDSKGEYTTAGCCKIPFKLNIEKGGDADHEVILHYLTPGQIDQATRYMLGIARYPPEVAVAVDTGNLYYPEDSPNTYAHEVGHMMGFPDQYETGAVAAGAMSITGPTMGSNWPIDDASVMGSNMNTAKKIHTSAKWFTDWINSKLGDDFGVIDK